MIFIQEYLFSIIPIQHSVWLYVVRAVEDSNIQRGFKNETEWHLFDPFRIISGLSTHRRRKDMKRVQKVSCIDCPKLSRILIDRCNMFVHCLVSSDTNCKLIYIEMQPIMNHNFQQARSNLISLYITAFDDVTMTSHRLNLRLDLINTLIDICVDFWHIFFACSACQWTKFLI